MNAKPLLWIACAALAPLYAQQSVSPDREAAALAYADQAYTQAKAMAEADARATAMSHAAELYAAYVRDFPKAAQRNRGIYMVALCRAESGDVAASNRVFEQLAKTTKGEFAAAAAYRLGLQAAERQDWKTAITYFQLVKAQTKRAALRNDAQYRMARALLQDGQRREAEEAFRAVLVLTGVKQELRNATYQALAQMKSEDGSDAEAYAMLRNLLQQSGTNDASRGAATLQAARLAAKLGKSDEAQVLYGRLQSIPGMEGYATEAHYERVQSLFSDKKYAEVIRDANRNNAKLQDASKEARRDVIVGQSCMEMKQYEAASQWFSAAEQAQPGTPLAADAGYRRLICVQQERKLNFFTQAENYLSVYARPGSATAALPCVDLVRLMYADRMMTADAAAAARQFEALNLDQLPEAVRPDAEYKKAWCAAAGDQYDPVPTLDHFISTYPQAPQLANALVLRGTAHAARENVAQALADFDRVVSEFPDSEAAAAAWQRAAQLCGRHVQDKNSQDKMVKYYQGLIQYYQALVKRGGRAKPAVLADAHYNIACALYDTNPKEAIPHFREARTMSAEQYAALVDQRLVQCYFKLKDAEGLRAALETLERTNTATYSGLPAAILRWCGWACYQSGDYLAANKYLTDGLAREPREKYRAADGSEQERPKVEPLVWKTLARSRLELGLFPLALEAAQHYVSMETQPYRKAEGMNDEARILVGLKRPSEARRLCNEALDLGIDGPIKSSLLLTLGDACYAEGKFGEAAQYYGRVANTATEKDLKPNALYRLAAALRRAGKTGEAEPYEEALNRDFPTWNPSEQVQKLIKRP